MFPKLSYPFVFLSLIPISFCAEDSRLLFCLFVHPHHSSVLLSLSPITKLGPPRYQCCCPLPQVATANMLSQDNDGMSSGAWQEPTEGAWSQRFCAGSRGSQQESNCQGSKQKTAPFPQPFPWHQCIMGHCEHQMKNHI